MVQGAYYLSKLSNMQEGLALLLLWCASMPAGLAVSRQGHALSTTSRAPGVCDASIQDVLIQAILLWSL